MVGVLMPKGVPLTKQQCFHIASGFDNLGQFAKYNRSAYAKCLKEGWLETMTWLSRERKVRGTWTKESCRKEAWKYTSLSEFWKNCPSACTTARKHGWIKEYVWLTKSRKGRNQEAECRKVARKYKTLKDFRDNDKTMYMAAWRYGWLAGFTWLKRGRKIKKARKCKNS